MAPFERQDSSDEDPIDSDGSSPSLFGSMKINRLSCLNWPEPGESLESEARSLESMRIEQGLSVRQDQKQRAELCETSPHQSKPRKVANEEEENQEDNSVRACSQASVLTAQWAPEPLDDIHRIDAWEGTSEVWTIVTSQEQGKVRVHHVIQLTANIPQHTLLATRFSLPIVMRNGGLCFPQTIHFSPGQTAYIGIVGGEPVASGGEQEAQFTVVRQVQDLDIPLKFYFSYDYSLKDCQVVVRIPSFRPQAGKLRSEATYIGASCPPLTAKPLTRRQLSTWKLGPNTTEQVTHYERMPLQRLYPERLSDDVRLHITDPCPVSFQSLGGLAPSDVVWDFVMTVERSLNAQLVCKMSLVLHVGDAARLLTLQSQGWIPGYSVINGRLATDEWRQVEGMTLFKQPEMINGPLKVNIAWHIAQDSGRFKLALPVVASQRILPGKLTCHLDQTLVIIESQGATERVHRCWNGLDVLLPKLHPGYQMYLTSFTEAPPSALLATSKAEETTGRLKRGSSVIEKTDFNKESQRTADVNEAVNDHHKKKVYMLVGRAMCIVVLLGWTLLYNIWLVPLFQCSVESLRVQTSDLKTAYQEDKIPETPVPVLASYQKEVDKVTPLRDWVDCLLGWGGEVCKPKQDKRE